MNVCSKICQHLYDYTVTSPKVDRKCSSGQKCKNVFQTLSQLANVQWFQTRCGVEFIKVSKSQPGIFKNYEQLA